MEFDSLKQKPPFSLFIYLFKYYLIYLLTHIIYINMKKKMFTNQINADLLKNFKKLAIDLERPINDVLEEAMRNILKYYDKQKSKKDSSSSPVLPF